MKRYINASLLYALLAMVGGVFYREFTKFNGFTARTSLGVVHTHYFLLGMVFFLLLLLLEKSFSFTGAKTKRALTTYHIGLNMTAVMLVVRGIPQVLGTELSAGMTAAISGVAGIGHILLAEDNALNAEIVKKLLEDRGAEVEAASDGRQALEAFESHKPGTYAAILMDVMMPNMDGLDATRAIRALDRADAKVIPIIAMTANAFEEDARKCMEAGMNAHLPKPIRIERLVAVIAGFCGARQA